MKLDEAIKENEATVVNKSAYLLPSEIVAIKMSIDALKRIKAKRLHFEVDIDRLLTGETREVK